MEVSRLSTSRSAEVIINGSEAQEKEVTNTNYCQGTSCKNEDCTPVVSTHTSFLAMVCLYVCRFYDLYYALP